MTKLRELPLISEGLLQVHLDGGGWYGGKRGGWFINRHAEIPKEWEEEFLAVERALGAVAGKTLADCAVGRNIRLMDDSIGMGEMALDHVYMGMVEGLVDCEEMIQRLLNDFFDGDEDSRHQRMYDLFLTSKYEY